MLSCLAAKEDVIAKRVVVTGITRQDGSYLAELLLVKGYEDRQGVFTTVIAAKFSRRESPSVHWNAEQLHNRCAIALRHLD